MATASANTSRTAPEGRSADRSTAVAGVLLVLWFVLCSGAVFPLLEMGNGVGLSDESAARLRWLLVPNVVAVPLLTLLRARPILDLLRRHPTIVLLVLWIWATVFWSVDPALSARRALSFTANTMIACFVVSYFRPEEIIRKLLYVATGLVLLSLLFAVMLPELAFMPDDGNLRGVFTHKNGMGALLVIAATVLAVGARAGLVSPLGLAGGFAIIAALLFSTGSATAMMLAGLIAILHVPVAIATLPRRLATAGLLFVLLGGLGLLLPLIFGRNRIFMAIGRDPTLTGRTELWTFVRGMIDQRPLHGYGYHAFFDLPGLQEHLLALVGWPAPNAHNGYLEVWLGLGLIGLLLTLAFLLGGLLRAARLLIDEPRSPAACFAFFSLGVYLARNFSESDLLDQSSLSWIVAVLGALVVGVSPQPSRRSAASRVDGSGARVCA